VLQTEQVQSGEHSGRFFDPHGLEFHQQVVSVVGFGGGCTFEDKGNGDQGRQQLAWWCSHFYSNMGFKALTLNKVTYQRPS
jgi:hypothetical protein